MKKVSIVRVKSLFVVAILVVIFSSCEHVFTKEEKIAMQLEIRKADSLNQHLDSAIRRNCYFIAYWDNIICTKMDVATGKVKGDTEKEVVKNTKRIFLLGIAKNNTKQRNEELRFMRKETSGLKEMAKEESETTAIGYFLKVAVGCIVLFIFVAILCAG